MVVLLIPRPQTQSELGILNRSLPQMTPKLSNLPFMVMQLMVAQVPVAINGIKPTFLFLA